MKPGSSPLTILWADFETTGLEAKRGAIIEGALVLTNERLNILDSVEAVIRPRPNVEWDDVALEMHRKSGLYDACHSPEAMDLEEAERLFCGYAAGWMGDERWEIGGSSVHFDREWMERHMPSLAGLVHEYRNVDVSTVKRLMRWWRPEVAAAYEEFKPPPIHRSFGDIVNTLYELRTYKEALMPDNLGLLPPTELATT